MTMKTLSRRLTAPKRCLLLWLCLLFAPLAALAQQYVVDPLFADSVNCYRVVLKDSVWKEATDKQRQVLTLSKGTVIQVDTCKKSNLSSYLIFDHGNWSYRISRSDLKWSELNPAETENPLPLKQRLRHSKLGKFFSSYGPCWLVVGLLAFVYILFFVTVKFPRADLILSLPMIVPVCLLLVAAVEIGGYALLGGDVFWWCDYDRYGFFGSLWRVIPFVLVVAAQLYVIKIYDAVLMVAADLPDDDNGIHLRSLVWAFVLPVPIAIVYMIVVYWLLGWKGDASTMVLVLLMLGVFVGGFVNTFRRNINTYGAKLGVWVSLFSIIYVIASLIAIGGLVYLIIRLIIQIIIALVVLAILGGSAGKTVYRDGSGNLYEKDTFGNLRRLK